MDIKTLSINLADSPVRMKRKKRINILCEEIRKISPDIIFLQELTSKRSAKIISDNLKGYKFFGGNNTPMKFGGLLIATKIGGIGSGDFQKYHRQATLFPMTWSDKVLGKGYLAVKIGKGKERILVINTHLVANYIGTLNGDRLIETQLDQLAEFVKGQAGKVIVSGDFNICSTSDIYKDFLKKSGLTDPLLKHETFSFNLNSMTWLRRFIFERTVGQKKADFTLYKGFGKKKMEQKMIFDQKLRGTYLSDHLAVFTKIKV